MNETTYSIAELAREFHVPPRTIRHYEDQELLAPRREGMHRDRKSTRLNSSH